MIICTKWKLYGSDFIARDLKRQVTRKGTIESENIYTSMETGLNGGVILKSLTVTMG